MKRHLAEEIRIARLALAKLDTGLARAHDAAPLFAWRVKERGFAGLVRLVLEQQVSIASALAIWQRLEAGLGQVTAEVALRHDVEQLKRYGLSGPKARYVLAIAEAEREGRLNFDLLKDLNDRDATAHLVAVKGVGRWTAEVYLMGCEGRTDVFPAGDLALQEGVRLADGATVRMTEKALYARAEAWRPYRGVAALLLWSYYAQSRKPTGSSRKAVGAVTAAKRSPRVDLA
ncbi:DNA-3-methyladenine glycosylase [Acidisoma sp. S159]|uniref:DNA-3-methyladenine glycosylase family protein n=1 Tax=Acidisoma sp. S159 TaxID=1747225 RepID=UPI00131D76DC|nr:DNA-3-methyladenine glycosylase 2 family protein [Acidisoma sp. S159]